MEMPRFFLADTVALGTDSANTEQKVGLHPKSFTIGSQVQETTNW